MRDKIGISLLLYPKPLGHSFYMFIRKIEHKRPVTVKEEQEEYKTIKGRKLNQIKTIHKSQHLNHKAKSNNDYISCFSFF